MPRVEPGTEVPGLLGIIPRNTTERLEIRWSEYKGHRFLDVRQWYQAEDGSWQPTKKGCTCPADAVGELAAILATAARTEEA